MKTNKQAKQVLSLLTNLDKHLPKSKRLGNKIVVTVYADGYCEVTNKLLRYQPCFEYEHCFMNSNLIPIAQKLFFEKSWEEHNSTCKKLS